MEHDPYLIDVIVILTAAVVSASLFRRLKLAVALGYLIAGAAIGPFGIGFITDVETVRPIAEFGVLFLLFTIGLELPLERLRVLPLTTFALGLVQVLATGAFAAAVAVGFGLPVEAAVVIGLGLALSSTVFVVQFLIDRGRLATRFGRTALAVLLTQDIVVGPILVVILALGAESESLGRALGLAVGKAVLALAAFLLVGRYGLRHLFRFAAIARNTEVFVATTLLLVLATALLTRTAGLSMALGGFLAGMMLAETQYRHQVAAEIQPFRGLLLGLFFMTVGMSADLDLTPPALGAVAALAVAIIVCKGLILAGLALAFRLSAAVSVSLGLMLSQGGEFGFILLGVGVMQGVLAPELANLLIVAIAVTLLLTPVLAHAALTFNRRFGRFVAARGDAVADGAPMLGDHVVVGGYGRVGRTIGAELKAGGIPYIAVDLDPDRVAQARARGETVFYGDATRPEVLEALRIESARAMVIALDNPRAATQLAGMLRYVFPGLRVLARAHDDDHAEELRNAGADLVIPQLVATGERLADSILGNEAGRG